MAEYCSCVTNARVENLLAGLDVYGFEYAFNMTDALGIELDAGGSICSGRPIMLLRQASSQGTVDICFSKRLLNRLTLLRVWST
jgi:hypothetical protein